MCQTPKQLVDVKNKKMNNKQLRKLIRESIILEALTSSDIIGYFPKLTSDRGPSGTQVDDDIRSSLIGLALPAIEQTSISSNNISTLISNLLILKDEYDTTDGKSLQQQPEEVQTAVKYLSSKEAISAFNEISDIDASIAAALKAGADTLGGSTEKIYTASAFPDGMRDSDFYKKAVEDGYKFILKPYLNGRSAQTLPVGDDGFTLEEIKRLKLKKLVKESIKQMLNESYYCNGSGQNASSHPGCRKHGEPCINWGENTAGVMGQNANNPDDWQCIPNGMVIGGSNLGPTLDLAPSQRNPKFNNPNLRRPSVREEKQMLNEACTCYTANPIGGMDIVYDVCHSSGSMQVFSHPFCCSGSVAPSFVASEPCLEQGMVQPAGSPTTGDLLTPQYTDLDREKPIKNKGLVRKNRRR